MIIGIIFLLIFRAEKSSDILDKSLALNFEKIGNLIVSCLQRYRQDSESLEQSATSTSDIWQTLQKQLKIQKDTIEEQYDGLRTSKKQRLWNFLISHERTFYSDLKYLETLSKQDKGNQSYQEFLSEIEEYEELLLNNFKQISGAIASEDFPRKIQPLEPVLAKIEQKLTARRSQPPITLTDFDDKINFFAVLFTLREISNNLQQMTDNWPEIRNNRMNYPRTPLRYIRGF